MQLATLHCTLQPCRCAALGGLVDVRGFEFRFRVQGLAARVLLEAMKERAIGVISLGGPLDDAGAMLRIPSFFPYYPVALSAFLNFEPRFKAGLGYLC